jgi:quercetin dioxygenase-like cupin family protein
MTEEELTDGTLALGARRLALEPRETAARVEAPAGESFLYVIGGSGRVQAAGESAALAAESVVWLEPGDTCELEAGDDGLRLLLAHAPGTA